MDAREFFAELYRGVDPEKLTTLCLLPEKWFYPYEIGRIENMLARADSLMMRSDVYFSLFPVDKPPKNGHRTCEDDVTIIPFLHSDHDIKGPAHKEERLPKTMDEALDYLHGLEHPPSIIVYSGNGLHAYWLLEEPFSVTGENREWVKSVLGGHQMHLNRLGKERGWKFDNVSDLARILRVPDTQNHKSDPPVNVRVIEATLKRYPLSAFEKYIIPIETQVQKEPFSIDPQRLGLSERVIDRCPFMQHCRDDAQSLSEPEWYAMISNLALVPDGEGAVHALSEPYSGYSREETQRKIKHAQEQKKPHTCRHICEHLGFDCPSEGCGVKAPVVHAILSREECAQKLLERTLTPDEVFAEDVLSAMAYARANLPIIYGKFKLRLRKVGVSIRDFERAVAYQEEREKEPTFEVIAGGEEIHLPGLDLGGAVEPDGFIVSIEAGIKRSAMAFGDAVWIPVAPSVVVITKRLENVDDGQEKLELTFWRNGKYKSIIIPRASVMNKVQLVRYADSGLPVNSGNAEDMVSYLAAYEAKNDGCIPLIRSIDRIGWVGDEFFPYKVNSEIRLETENVSIEQMLSGLTQSGEFDTWLKAAQKLRENCISRANLSAAFASPLLKPLGHRQFSLHTWYMSRSGKTASLKGTLSVYGDPERLMSSYHATAVGLERSCAAMKHLPLGLDELQVLSDRRLSADTIIYSLCNGMGKARGAKNGGLQKTLHWRNIIISTGEMSIVKENSMDGVASRVLELYGRAIEDEAGAREIHQISERHYGHAGKRYIEYLVSKIIPQAEKLEEMYRNMQRQLREQYGLHHSDDPGIHFDNITVLCLGDYLSSMSVFDLDEDTAWTQAVQFGVKWLENNAQLQPEDSIQRAWDFTVDWIGSNRDHFRSSVYSHGVTRYGSIAAEHVNLIPSTFRKALEDAGFNYAKSVKGFVSRGLFDSFTDTEGKNRSQYQCKIDGVNMRVFRCKLKVGADDSSEDDFLK